MNRAALMAVALLLAACPETGVRVVPNTGPVAIAGIVSEVEGEEVLERIGTTVLGDAARFDGSGSTDPDVAPGEVLTFQWSLLSRPEGSAVILDVPEDDDDTAIVEPAFPTLQPDVEGTYRVQLVVVDADGAESLPAVMNLQAVPPSSLEITLAWDVVRTDLDIHLVQPGGTYWSDDDCFAWNPTPDWGLTGFDADDPVLDVDDDGEGQGPYREILTLEAPRSGTYQILVHYFSDQGAALGQDPRTVAPSVTVFAAGALAIEPVQPPATLREGDVWRVSEFQWPDRSHAPPVPAIVSHTELGGPPVQQTP